MSLICRCGVASYAYMNGQLATLVASAQMQSISCVAKQGNKCSVELPAFFCFSSQSVTDKLS